MEEAEKLEVQVLEIRKRRLGEERSFYGQSRFHLLSLVNLQAEN